MLTTSTKLTKEIKLRSKVYGRKEIVVCVEGQELREIEKVAYVPERNKFVIFLKAMN